MRKFLPLALVVAGALGWTSTGYAQTPNLQPGLWEYSSRSSTEPKITEEETSVETKCLTQGEIESMAQDPQMTSPGCEVVSHYVGRDSARTELSCEFEDESGVIQAQLLVETRFQGAQAETRVAQETMTLMGPIKLNVVSSGRRIGDC